MNPPFPAATDVFSVQEIARAAGVPITTARALIGSYQDSPGYFPAREAVHYVRLLRQGLSIPRTDELFIPRPGGQGSPATGIVASGALHAVIAVMLVLLTTLGFTESARTPPEPVATSRLVFLASPGVGGGGGGGGLKHPKPPARAEMRGTASLKSPIPPPRRLTTQRPEPPVRRTEPTPVAAQPLPRSEPPPPPVPVVTPSVVAPVASASSDAQDRAGVPIDKPLPTESQGSGSGGGAGTGQGSGLGEGSGAGVGPGSGGGTGGGPYRPGSGITAPNLLHEVRPDYTEDARRRGTSGDVVLEIVVRQDGTVGDVTLLRGLGAGLDRRAIDAVKQWRFTPARRYGTPVDVIVEVTVEFKLR